MPLAPGVAAALDDYVTAVWSDPLTDARRLELCRLRMATLLAIDATVGARRPEVADGDVAELAAWPTSSRFSAADRAALAFTEQWTMDVGGMSDELCAALRHELGDAGCAAFTLGLSVVEAQLRVGATVPAP